MRLLIAASTVLLLVAAPPIPFCTTVQVVAFVQHLAGLAMIFGVGWIAGHFVRRPNIWVPIIAFLPAIWPRMLYYEHEMICETLLLGVFIAAVAVWTGYAVLLAVKKARGITGRRFSLSAVILFLLSLLVFAFV
jgi:hypothetical protein